MPYSDLHGIIPANTGKIYRRLKTRATAGDHPREYGENYIMKLLTRSTAGSSPRIRGKSKYTAGKQTLSGIIPANTGKMLAGVDKVVEERDHPREYGENDAVHLIAVTGEGSSPRIRGKWQ